MYGYSEFCQNYFGDRVDFTRQLDYCYDADLFCDAQIQKFGSTRKRIGLQYSRYLNELYVRDVFVLKFQTSVVTLKIQNSLKKATISIVIC